MATYKSTENTEGKRQENHSIFTVLLVGNDDGNLDENPEGIFDGNLVFILIGKLVVNLDGIFVGKLEGL